MNIESVTEEVAKRLAAHLKSAVPKLKSTKLEFPEPNEKLDYPCLTVDMGTVTFRALQPYELENPPAPANHLSEVKWVVGIYDIPIQLDLWTRNKEERDDLFHLLFEALNPNITPMGLSLRLTDYYNLWCRYDVTGHDTPDTERASQQGEFRVKIDLLANCKAVRLNKSRIMETIQTDLQVLDEDDDIEP